jgi:hypothetical protein
VWRRVDVVTERLVTEEQDDLEVSFEQHERGAHRGAEAAPPNTTTCMTGHRACLLAGDLCGVRITRWC